MRTSASKKFIGTVIELAEKEPLDGLSFKRCLRLIRRAGEELGKGSANQTERPYASPMRAAYYYYRSLNEDEVTALANYVLAMVLQPQLTRGK